MKTVRETISSLIAMNIEARLEKLTAMGAPRIMIDSTAKLLEDAKAGRVKINGLERKHKAVADEAVIELAQAETTGYYFKGGKQKTLVLKMTTAAGVYYYDYHDNKIGASFTELSVNVTDDKFEAVEV